MTLAKTLTIGDIYDRAKSGPKVDEKGLNAKPCGILDSAHTTHGLNP